MKSEKNVKSLVIVKEKKMFSSSFHSPHGDCSEYAWHLQTDTNQCNYIIIDVIWRQWVDRRMWHFIVIVALSCFALFADADHGNLPITNNLFCSCPFFQSWILISFLKQTTLKFHCTVFLRYCVCVCVYVCNSDDLPNHLVVHIIVQNDQKKISRIFRF